MTAAASSATDAAAVDPQESVDRLIRNLRTDRITYFPIRHHSPACAAHIKRWIERRHPASVLIEGPESFTGLVSLLADAQCLYPVAVYVNFVDRSGRLAALAGLAPDADVDPSVTAKRSDPPLRFSAYYPFCDYSPEAVALRVGRESGARIRFIDLEYPEKVLAGFTPPSRDEKDNPEEIRVESLAADLHLSHSEYSRALALRLGCRDFDELWDHLFEANNDAFDTDEFMNRLAAYCVMTRLTFRPEDLQADGTIAREQCMAAAILDELKANERDGRKGPVLVVTGGFHTVALPDLVASGNVRRPAAPRLKSGETGAWLMRYSFDQLDSLAGYASGMPSPAFYDRMWAISQGAGADPASRDAARTQSAIGILSEIGRMTRQQQFNPAATTPDVIAAAQMVRQLAEFRGHRWPQREDVLDSIRSCFIKGETEAEGRGLLQLVRKVLAGDRVGQTPPDTGTPPIVHDFRAQAKRLKLSVESVETRELALDLYREDRHREISRLFHRLSLLEVPFAHFLRGPDFVQGVGLDLMNEHWRVGWSPNTDSGLIEASIFGPTISEAAFARLQDQVSKLADKGESRNTAAAVDTLVRACRMGLHEHVSRLVEVIDEHIAEDPQLPSVVQGLAQLELLLQSREPLEAGNLTALPKLMVSAYHRCCRLIGDIATCSDDVVTPLIEALKSLREILQSATRKTVDEQPVDEQSNMHRFDVELFHQALQRVIDHPADKAQSPIVGAAAGVLYGDGVLTSGQLMSIAGAYLGGSMRDAAKCCGVVRGLLATAREIAWHVQEVLQALDAQFSGWNEETFLQVLPEMRLAFAELTPREIANVADQVAQLHGHSTMGELIQMDLTEEDVQYALHLTIRVRQSLQTDGFLSNPPECS